MRIVPSRVSALAGAWCAVGCIAAETFGKNHAMYPVVTQPVLNRLTNVAVVLIFFVGPSFVFVGGIEDMNRWRWRSQFTREHWREDVPQMTVRALCWFVGAALGGSAFWYVVKDRWP
jgi:hypothetical protein